MKRPHRFKRQLCRWSRNRTAERQATGITRTATTQRRHPAGTDFDIIWDALDMVVQRFHQGDAEIAKLRAGIAKLDESQAKLFEEAKSYERRTSRNSDHAQRLRNTCACPRNQRSRMNEDGRDGMCCTGITIATRAYRATHGYSDDPAPWLFVLDFERADGYGFSFAGRVGRRRR